MRFECFLHILSKIDNKSTYLFLAIYLYIVTGKAALFHSLKYHIHHLKIY